MFRTKRDTKYRQEYYMNPDYDQIPLYKEGDVVWVYVSCTAGRNRLLLYEAKVGMRCPELVPYFFSRPEGGHPRYRWVAHTVNIPFCVLEMPWKRSQHNFDTDDDAQLGDDPTINDCYYEVELYDPKRLSAEEIYNVAGTYNQNILSGLSEMEKQAIPTAGLVFLGKSQLAEIERYIARSRNMQQEIPSTATIPRPSSVVCGETSTSSSPGYSMLRGRFYDDDDDTDDDWTCDGPDRASTAFKPWRRKARRLALKRLRMAEGIPAKDEGILVEEERAPVSAAVDPCAIVLR